MVAMIRTGLIVLVMALVGCGNKESQEELDDGSYSYEKLSSRFKTITPPYQLSDTGFLKNKDTALLRFTEFASFISDSIKTKLFGKNAKIRFTAMVQMKPADETSLYMVKAVSGKKKAALLMAFQDGEPQAILPFLVPDSDPTTSQLSSIDRSFVVYKYIRQQKPGSLLKEGREVYEYDAVSKTFSHILSDPFNIENADVVNPIDTFPRNHKYSGDYIKDKKNFISIRDGRYENQLRVFIHIEKKNGCKGELKGELLITSPTQAIYRQGGDPCVLSFRFSKSALILKEDEGCGAHRGLDCVFDGSYPKKKELKPSGKKAGS